MKTRRHRLVRSHRKNRSHRKIRSHRNIRSNCKKTRQRRRRTFRRAQHVGGGRKSRYRSKKLKGGAQHFDPNVKPTKDGLGYKKDFLIENDLIVKNMTPSDLISKVEAYFTNFFNQKNILLDLKLVEAYKSENEKFIRVKIFPSPLKKADYTSLYLYEGALTAMTLKDFKENIYGGVEEIVYQIKPSASQTSALPTSASNFENIENLKLNLNTQNTPITGNQQLFQKLVMPVINKLFNFLSLPAKQQLFIKLKAWFLMLDDTQKNLISQRTKLSDFTPEVISNTIVGYLLNQLNSVSNIENFIRFGPQTVTDRPIAEKILRTCGVDFDSLLSPIVNREQKPNRFLISSSGDSAF